VVAWGRTPALGQRAVPDGSVRHPRMGNQLRVYQARLTGLEPGETVFYRLERPDEATETFSFRTRPETPESFRFVVYADPQWDPQVHRTLVEDGILPTVLGEEPVEQLSSRLAFTLVAGDLVHVGSDFLEYRTKFFDPAQAVSARVPYYPALGNHEYQGLEAGERPIYLDYFRLPENGTPEYVEEWYSFDYGSAHVVSLNANPGAEIQFQHHPNLWDPEAAAAQLDWLEADLKAACDSETTRFVFLVFHHGNLNELWASGNEAYSQTLIDKAEACGKPGAAFMGHTHGYSRGQSPGASFYRVTAASAGGRLDRWGEYENVDYDSVQKTLSTYGFLVVEVDGDRLALTRYGMGEDPNALAPPEPEDTFGFDYGNMPPLPPDPGQPAEEGGAWVLKASAFQDPGDQHLESQWRIETTSAGQAQVVYESWDRFENWYQGKNTEEGRDLTQHRVDVPLENDGLYRWRVRYRDAGLRWSAWSEPASLPQ
jgi:hypothetical protein